MSDNVKLMQEVFELKGDVKNVTIKLDEKMQNILLMTTTIEKEVANVIDMIKSERDNRVNHILRIEKEHIEPMKEKIKKIEKIIIRIITIAGTLLFLFKFFEKQIKALIGI